MFFSLMQSLNLFDGLSTPDSLIILSYLVAAFLLGAWTYALIIRQRARSEHRSNGNSDMPDDLKKAQAMIGDLNRQIIELKQSHSFLSKDYEVLLEALHSAREQAEHWQRSTLGSNIQSGQESPEAVAEARERLKEYVKKQLLQRSDQMDFKTALVYKVGEQRLHVIDLMDDEMVMMLEKLIDSK